MNKSAYLKLYSRSKTLASSLKECLLKSGGVRVEEDQIHFPVHPRGSAEELFTKVCICDYIGAGAEDPSPAASAETAGKPNFNAAEYFHHLKTDLLGNCLLFAERIPSTVHVIDRLSTVLPGDVSVVCVAAQQSSGKGRSGNVWESPLGCAMFSFPLTVPLASRLGQALSFVQHLVATACVLAVRSVPGYETVDLRIKWPNDILTSEKIKVGGVLVTSSVMGQKAYCNVGVGFNVANIKPTICLNELVERTSPALLPFTVEKFIARMLSELERLLKCFAAVGDTAFLPIYLKYWLHMNQEVTVRRTSEDPKAAPEDIFGEIVGLDKYGFLLVRVNSGELWSVQSDGNRFDMMANLLLVQKVS